MRNSNKALWWIVAALALPVVGCVGHGPSASSDELFVSEGETLEELDEDDWASAPPGCEGLLGGDEHFAIASAEDELVAAVGANGTVVCVDTVDAVQEELSETGQVAAAGDLVTAFRLTVQSVRTTNDSKMSSGAPGSMEGDPRSIDWNGWRQFGDPDPQPSTGT